MKKIPENWMALPIDETNLRFEVVKGFVEELIGFQSMIEGLVTGGLHPLNCIATFVESARSKYEELITFKWHDGENTIWIECVDKKTLQDVVSQYKEWFENLEDENGVRSFNCTLEIGESLSQHSAFIELYQEQINI